MNPKNAHINLEFQQKYFGTIFNSYNNLNEETVESKFPEKNKDKEKIKDKILILTNNYKEVLESLNIPKFMLEEIKEDLDDYEEIIITNSSIEDIEYDGNNKILKLQYTHGYKTKCFKLDIIKKFNYSLLKETIKVVIMRSISTFEDSILKREDVDIIVLSAIKDLKKFLINLECFYCEKNFLDNVIKVKTIEEIPYSLNDSIIVMFKQEICLNIIEALKTNKMNAIEANMLNEALSSFEKNSIKILEKFIIKNQFALNFFIIDAYINNYNILKETAFNIIKEELIKEINEIIAEYDNSTEIYLRLQESKIGLLENLVLERLDFLLKDIQIVKTRMV